MDALQERTNEYCNVSRSNKYDLIPSMFRLSVYHYICRIAVCHVLRFTYYQLSILIATKEYSLM